MHSIRLILLLISVLFTNACAALTITPEKKVDSEAPAIMLKLPKTVESFDMQGFKYFNDGSGYSIRYSNERKQRLADLYIYDVAEENASLDHKQLVLGSTKATMDAIGAAAKQGHYANYSVLNAAMHAQGLRTVARVQATYLRQNLASYTLVYQTEYKGTLLKIRVTMPDNDSNRNSREWDLFTDTVFQSVISELDSTSMEQADSTESSEL
ncbi:MAG: hypothetical protein ACI9XK_001951 [Granulosicoccus sp.]|jgi:hypothetical protein